MLRKIVPVLFATLVLSSLSAQAHFGMVIPDKSTITQKARSATLTLSFSHPFEQRGMDLVKPKHFTVTRDEETTDLLSSLKPAEVMDHNGWTTTYRFKRPGVYQFAMEPQPYWEPAEDVFIIHYTKTIVAAFGEEDGWQEPIGLPTEIVPMLRPFGNYAGNSFTGQVLRKGEPVSGAEVEVELYNQELLTPPTDYHITQVIKADNQGRFTFTCPLPGWWGFAALSTADTTITGPDGKQKDVEMGAVLWTYFNPLPQQRTQKQ